MRGTHETMLDKTPASQAEWGWDKSNFSVQPEKKVIAEPINGATPAPSCPTTDGASVVPTGPFREPAGFSRLGSVSQLLTPSSSTLK